MAETIIDLKGNVIVADEFRGAVTPADVPATSVDVAAYATSGIDAGTLQAVLEALADRIQALEDVP